MSIALQTVNCIIVDDEPLAQNILEDYINRTRELNLLKKCSTASEAFEALHTGKVELIFLDIRMPGMTGIDFIKSLKSPPSVIFSTAYSEYAAASYDLEAIDYLLKPITFDRFTKSMDKLFKLQPVALTEEKEYTYFKVSGKMVKIQHSEIFYAQSIKDYILLCTAANNLIVHMTMKYLCDLLPARKFTRVHRSYLVNNASLSGISKNEITIGLVQIPIGESYRRQVQQLKENL